MMGESAVAQSRDSECTGQKAVVSGTFTHLQSIDQRRPFSVWTSVESCQCTHDAAAATARAETTADAQLVTPRRQQQRRLTAMRLRRGVLSSRVVWHCATIAVAGRALPRPRRRHRVATTRIESITHTRTHRRAACTHLDARKCSIQISHIDYLTAT
jgi:hypothetical protein